MQIVFNDIPYTLIPGVYGEFDFSKANRSLIENIQKLMLLGQRLKARIEPARWQGGTLNDCTAGGTYTGDAKKNCWVKISVAAATDKFQYSIDRGVTWSSETDITGSAQALEDGVTVTFGATTGHAVDDEWRFGAWPDPTVAEKVPTQIWSDVEAAVKLGYGSMVHMMARAALAAGQAYQLFVCALDDDGAAVVSAGAYTFSGTCVAAGYFRGYLGGKMMEINIAKNDAAAEVAIAWQNKIADYLDQLPADPAVDQTTAGKVNMTAKNGGVVGNQIPLAYDMTALGITCAISDMASGATDPDIDDATDAAAAGDYTIYVNPYNDAAALGKLKVHLDEVSGPVEQRSAIGVSGYTGLVASGISLADGVNHGRVNIPFIKNSGSKYQDIPYELAAGYAAMIAARFDAVTSLDGVDIKNLHAPTLSDRLTRAEHESLLLGGLTPLGVNSGEVVEIVRAVTTRTENDQGVPDTSQRELGTITGLDYVRKDIVAAIALRFTGVKKTDRITKEIWSEIFARQKRLEEAEIIKNVDVHKDSLVVQDNATDVNRLDCYVPIDIVGALHVTALQFGLILS